jgi:hypothetical protein
LPPLSYPHLLLAHCVRSGSEDSIASTERLRAGTDTLQNLRTRKPLAVTQVDKELVQIAIEVLDLATGHEAEDGHLAVGSLVQLPARARNSNSSDGCASSGNRARATERRKPNHNLILRAARRRRACEQVIRDVRNQRVAAVVPRPRRRQRRHLADGLLRDLGHDVRVRLHVALAAGPRPLGVPFQRAAAEAVDAGALAARRGLVSAPQVVVGCVCTVDLVVPLAAEVGALLEGDCGCAGGSEGEGGRAGEDEEGVEFHFGDEVEGKRGGRESVCLWVGR